MKVVEYAGALGRIGNAGAERRQSSAAERCKTNPIFHKG